MNKKIIKIISLVCIVLFIVSMCVSSNAVVSKENVEAFGGSTTAEGAGAIKTILATILDIVRLAGAAIAVVMLMTIAAKYMVASSGDRADIKKYAFNYVIGAIILFAASGILTIIRDAITK